MATSIDHFLPPNIADALHGYVRGLSFTYGWRSNQAIGFAHWNHDIAQAGPSNGLDVSHRISGAVLDAWNFIKEAYLPGHVLLRCYANTHTYGVEGYPHTDSLREHDATVVVYMNRNWKREWGGETLIYDGQRIEHAELPAFNRGLIFKGNQLHCARGVTRICPDQRLTLMFKCAKIGADQQRDRLQLLLEKHNAGRYSHTNGTLANHLLLTYDMLKAAGLPDVVCLAGGAHSVFGTNAFTSVCIDPALRSEVVACIGEDATKIVELFSSIDRPSTLTENIGQNGAHLRLTKGGTVEVTKEQLDALVMIECANLSEQGELGGHRKLAQCWKSRGNP